MDEFPVCKNLVYRIICIPSTEGLEKAVQELLALNPNKRVLSQTFLSAPYHHRELEMMCPECGYRVLKKDKEYKCSDCGKEFTATQFKENAEMKISTAGMFYVQQIILCD